MPVSSIPDARSNLISGRRLARNTLWNLLGTGAPLLVAIVAIPLLIESMGMPRFGVLTLVWMVVGYFGLFDLGLGRALTKLVAEKLGAGRDSEIFALVWTAMALMTIIGMLGAVIVAGLSPWLVGGVLKIPKDLQLETLNAFYLLAASIPMVTSTMGLRGFLEANQRFGLVNAVRIPLGIFTFLGPLAVLQFSHNLVPVVAALVLARLIAWGVFIVLCLHVAPGLRTAARVHRAMVRPLLNFGGWMTVTNIVGPLMTYLDRFIVGAIVSMVAVAYYATSYDVVAYLSFIPGAVMGVLFPAFAASFVADRDRAGALYDSGVKYTLVILFPMTLILVTLAHEGLGLWLDQEFADKSFRILQVLAIGRLINGLAQLPFGLVQGVGRPDLTSKLHLAELPLYLVGVWFMVDRHGIEGAAIAWVIRSAMDTLLLFVIAQRFVPLKASAIRQIVAGLAGALFLIAAGTFSMSLSAKVFFLIAVLSAFVVLSWRCFLKGAHKIKILSLTSPHEAM